MRTATMKTRIKGEKTQQWEGSCVRDTQKLWNQAHKEIPEAQTIGTAKIRVRENLKTWTI